MDPYSGRLYESRDAALKDGVENPVELFGKKEDVERISAAVAKVYNKKQKRKKNKAARAARKANR
jgi:hypothetical protein